MMNCNYNFKGKNVAANFILSFVLILSVPFVDKNIMTGL
jgi:hypothetical protein